jgi:hypothetical protein
MNKEQNFLNVDLAALTEVYKRFEIDFIKDCENKYGSDWTKRNVREVIIPAAYYFMEHGKIGTADSVFMSEEESKTYEWQEVKLNEQNEEREESSEQVPASVMFNVANTASQLARIERNPSITIL